MARTNSGSRNEPLEVPTLGSSQLALAAGAGSTELAPIKKTSVRSARKTSSLDFAHQKAQEAHDRTQARQAATVLQQELPFWTDEHRGVPKPLIRSGLFGTKLTGKREFMKGQRVSSLSNIEIEYSGEELLQDDATIWIALINMASKKRFGDKIFFTGYQLIMDVRWRMHSDSYKRARESIQRLKVSGLVIRIRNKKGEVHEYSGSLIRDYEFSAKSPDPEDGNGAKWMVRFEPTLVELFIPELVSSIEWEQRLKLGSRNSLALWMHNFYSTHTEPYAYSVEKLHELTRSSEKHMRSFRARVRACLEQLVEVGFLKGYNITRAGLVQLTRAPVVKSKQSLTAAVTKRLPSA